MSSSKDLVNMTDTEIEELKKPLNLARYYGTRYDKIIDDKRRKCYICGKIYSKSNASKHRRTQYHKLHHKLTEKMRKIMLSN